MVSRSSEFGRSRRTVLRTLGAVTAGVALAGCSGGDGDGGGGDDGGGDGGGNGGGVSGSDYPAVDTWLTETDVGAADDTYDGTIVDQRGSAEVAVDVGSEGNGGNYAFGPSAIIVDAGTTVVWEWTGKGGLHNVVAAPEDQIQESDYTFGSGDPVDTAGETFEQTLDDTGVALYQCVPHLALGMKGAVVVE